MNVFHEFGTGRVIVYFWVRDMSSNFAKPDKLNLRDEKIFLESSSPGRKDSIDMRNTIVNG
jgi:hypothetical protein